MKRVFPQESAADSHSQLSNGFQPGALVGSRRVQTSAAMLGIALSFGTSAPVLFEPESALAAEGPVVAVLPTAGSNSDPARPVFVTNKGELASTTYHTVEEGDSLWHIAEEHQADVQSIKSANGIAPDEVLRVGQVLRVPSVIDSAEVAELPGKVHRLALNGNVRGSVGGDLSVVFGEDLPLGESSLQAEEGITSVAKLEADDAEPGVELTAAALMEQEEDILPGAEANAEEATVAALPASELPASMPLNEVKANPLEEVLQPSQISEVDEVTPAADASATFETAALTPETNVEEVSVAASPSELSESVSSSPSAVGESDWQDQAVQAADPAVPERQTDKSLAIAALGNTPAAAAEQDLEPTTPAANTQVYRVKAGDTLWNIASRHGLSVDDLMRHNSGQRAEDLLVGDSINIPVDATAGANATPELARASQLTSNNDRDTAIRDHLARIREAANREIDQEALKARIIAVRQSLENSEHETAVGGAPLEYHGSSDQEVSNAPGIETSVKVQPADAAEGNQSLVARATTVSQAQWSVTDAASQTDATEIAALTDTPEVTDTRSVPAAPSIDAEELLAAAPMIPDVYRASPQLPVGEVVTPGMPILPDSGEYLPEAPNRFNGYVWPAQGTLTSGYGWRWGRMHRGIDIAGPVGTPIMAAAPGVVVRSGWNSGGYGNLVDIRHADGSLTRYAHNSRLLVREGQEVRQGQQIAEMGSTGYSTGPHLHFEVHLPNSGTVNPLAHLPGR